MHLDVGDVVGQSALGGEVKEPGERFGHRLGAVRARPGDRRGKLVQLTSLGEETAVRAARVYLENIQRYFVEPLPEVDRERFAEDLRILGRTARGVLPRLP